MTKYVIEYTDGAFNQGAGFPCRLEEATLYESREAAEKAAETLADVFGITEYVPQKVKPALTFERLADAIEAATIEIVICSPSGDYYARSGDWDRQTIAIIDPAMLLALLRNPDAE